MRVSLIYCAPCMNMPVYGPLAQRFVRSYVENPPGLTDHELIIGLNGGELDIFKERLFQPLSPGWFEHNNFGKDLGLFMAFADRVECDLLICLGAHIRFHKPGWLDRIVEAYLENGPSVYGAWAFHQPRPHIRTTALWLPPELLRMYPYIVGDKQRYGFEHGPESITLWSQSKGFEPMMVTWNECLEMKQWRHISVEESLFLDQFMGGR